MNNNKEYKGRIDPEEQIWQSSPWVRLLVERYQLASKFCFDCKVLDSCCGTGWGTGKFIAPIAKKVVGFDISPPSTLVHYNKDRCSFLTMDAREIQLADTDFDVVLALDSIEHMTAGDALIYINGVKATLKSEGILLGSTPLVEKECLIPIFLSWNKHHIHMYTENSLETFLRKYFGYVSIHKIYNQVCPYFFFVCSDNIDPVKIVNLRMKEFIQENQTSFNRGKIAAYRLWAKHLLKRGSFCKAVRYLLSSYKANI